ncbi:MAG: hypothetical protein JO093_04755 [Acidobacteria bacterium]|nr:hypothetical protein [Acidobacteriota bacterium]MBV9070237.1 hypothetical protein [Acidobacteriota bacterium]MBV9184903.1 hypothetical protein [Acidobacteriota bacterium]
MRHKIFLVHGIGTYDGDEWADGVKKVLVEAYKKYPRLAAIDFDDQFETVMVHYDPIFQEIVGKWQTDSEAIGTLAGDIVPSQVETMVGWLKNAGETDGNFLWSHAADALLYRLSSTVRERVKVRVAKQIIDEVTKQYDTEQESLWSVIAHSLGTAVAHDALDMLATGHVPGAAVNAFDPKIEQANVIAMVANTSRLLETVVDAYESAVKPGRAGQAGRDCLRFLNFRHFLDPFTIPQMFHPQAWPDAATVSANRYKYVEVTHVHQANVHDINHYLINPAVHIPLFRALTSDSMISDEEEKKANDDFPVIGGLNASQVADIKGDLAKMSPSMGSVWSVLRDIWDAFHSILVKRGEA